MVGHGAAHPVGLADTAQQRQLRLRIGVEAVQAHHRRDAGAADRLHMVQQIGAAPLQQGQILLRVGVRQGTAGDDLRPAAVHLQGADGGHQHRHVRLQTGEAALHVPEFLKTDVSGEAGLGHMVVKQLDAQPVADHRRLTDGNIGKRPCVDQHRLMLHRIAQGGVNGIAHPRRHGARYLQILRGDGTALFIVGQHNIPDAAAQIGQIPRHGQDGHQLGADGDVGAGVHGVAVHFPVAADVHFPQRLTAEVQHEAPLYPRRVDVQAAQATLGQLGVVIVALVLHPGVQRRHGQIVGVHDVVDIAGKPQRELGHGDEQGVAAAGSSALDVHGRPAGGLAQAAAHVFPQPSQSLDETQGRGGLALA